MRFPPEPPSHPILPSRLSSSTRLSPLCYTGAPHWPSVLYMVMYIYQSDLLSKRLFDTMKIVD